MPTSYIATGITDKKESPPRAYNWNQNQGTSLSPREIRKLLPGRIVNFYGRVTTVWAPFFCFPCGSDQRGGLLQRWLAIHPKLCSFFHSIWPVLGSYFQPRIVPFHLHVTSSHKGMSRIDLYYLLGLVFKSWFAFSLYSLTTGCKEFYPVGWWSFKIEGNGSWNHCVVENHQLIKTTQMDHLAIGVTQNQGWQAKACGPNLACCYFCMVHKLRTIFRFLTQWGKKL